jgi:CheY-like chemotaxis protein
MGHKILLVDDSRELLDAYDAFLQSSTPYEVRAAASASAALQLARTWRPDIVATDVIMPDMNGLELITQMRSELAPPLPVIVAVSGFPDFEREARRRGAQVFQAKPIDTDDLAAHRGWPRSAPGCSPAISTTPTPPSSSWARNACRCLPPRTPAGWAEGTSKASSDTLIVPDLAAMPNGSSQQPIQGRRLLAAVPVRSPDGIAIGAVVLADRRPVPFDVQDLALLEHVTSRLGEVFAGAEGARLLEGPGLLLEESWRYCLGCEVAHLGRGRSPILALASLPDQGEPAIPVPSPAEMERLEQRASRPRPWPPTASWTTPTPASARSSRSSPHSRRSPASPASPC